MGPRPNAPGIEETPFVVLHKDATMPKASAVIRLRAMAKRVRWLLEMRVRVSLMGRRRRQRHRRRMAVHHAWGVSGTRVAILLLRQYEMGTSRPSAYLSRMRGGSSSSLLLATSSS